MKILTIQYVGYAYADLKMFIEFHRNFMINI